MDRNLRKERIGVVVSNKMDKSIVVITEHKEKHPMYGKFMKRSTLSLWPMMKKMKPILATKYLSWKHVH
jgi:hypothetical protein